MSRLRRLCERYAKELVRYTVCRTSEGALIKRNRRRASGSRSRSGEWNEAHKDCKHDVRQELHGSETISLLSTGEVDRLRRSERASVHLARFIYLHRLSLPMTSANARVHGPVSTGSVEKNAVASITGGSQVKRNTSGIQSV